MHDASRFTRIYASPADAFPAGFPRALAPELTLRTFDVPDTKATHVQLVVTMNLSVFRRHPSGIDHRIRPEARTR